MTLTRAVVLTAFFAVLAFDGSAAAAPVRRPVVVELFTSQGCSSCPPADELLGRLSARRDVLAISLPITYWDMLGWKDTLASEANTRRQKAYARSMGHGGIYTPQIIVDGVTDVVGSRDSEVEAAIARRAVEIDVAQARREAVAAAREASLAAREAQLAQLSAWHDQAKAQVIAAHEHLLAARRETVDASRPPSAALLSVPVSVSESPDAMRIAVGGSGYDGGSPATVWLFHLRNTVTVRIRSGENEGRTMTYHNVVGDLRPVGQWKGDAVSLNVPHSTLAGLPHDSVAVVVQQGGYGRVVGATLISHPDYDVSH
jgi:hypothetical protein